VWQVERSRSEAVEGTTVGRERPPGVPGYQPGSEHFEVVLHDGALLRSKVEQVVHGLANLGFNFDHVDLLYTLTVLSETLQKLHHAIVAPGNRDGRFLAALYALAVYGRTNRL